MNAMMHGESEGKGKKMAKALNCQQTRTLLATRTSEQGPRDDDPRLSDHLAACPACARLASDYQRDRARLGAYLHTADWSPVAKRPWQEVQPPAKRRAAWGRLATGANWLAGFGLAAVVALTLALVLPVMARGGSGSGGAGAAPSPSPSPSPTAPPAGAACTTTIISALPGELLPTPPPFNGTPVAITNSGMGFSPLLTPVPVTGGNQATTICTPPCAVTTAPAQGATTPTPTPASASTGATVVPGSVTLSATCLPITACAAVAAAPPVESTPTPTPAGTTTSTGTTAPLEPTPVPVTCTPVINSCVVTSIATPEGAAPATAPQGAPPMPTTVTITGGGDCPAVPGVPSLPAITPAPYDPTLPTPTIVPGQSATPTPTPAR